MEKLDTQACMFYGPVGPPSPPIPPSAPPPPNTTTYLSFMDLECGGTILQVNNPNPQNKGGANDASFVTERRTVYANSVDG